MRYDILTAIHELVAPQTYLEIGVRNGGSMSVSRCRSVGIDPAYSITYELDCDVALFRTTSDEYFARAEPLAPTGGRGFDLALIDGLHLFEYALRDFINTERHSTPRSVVIFDDVFPRNVDEAARERHTDAWTGDVFPVIDVLAKYRPDLAVIPVDTPPTGALLIVGLDPASTVLRDNWDAITAEFRHGDPQPVPQDVLQRWIAVPPGRALASGFWDVLRSADPSTTTREVQDALAPVLRDTLGAAFAPRPGATS